MKEICFKNKPIKTIHKKYEILMNMTKKDISLQTQIEIWDLCMYVKNSNIRRRINIHVNKKVFKYVRMHVCVEILCGCV